MADRVSSILDARGRPIAVPEKKVLTSDIAGPTLTGVRTHLSGYPADGLTPSRLASILREADEGNPLRFLELAELTEERDLHYAGILGTRKRSVSQLDISVEAASEDPRHEEQAERVRQWLKRDELTDELFDMLDAIGKGFSMTEIVWDLSERQYQPARLERRDQRWFRFSREDGQTPMLVGENGQDEDLPPFKFVFATIRAKSGLPIRSGIARLASWAWMFKAYTNRDWTIFTQTYGQPVRIGKYNRGATEDEKSTLYRAVANIAGDCAAIIPDGMVIDFIESKSVGTNSSLYKDRADWLDRQLSKAVLGQTATTDAIAGGHAVGQEHREVQEDIERADAKALGAILNRDLIRPWMMLEFGETEAFPRVKIGRPEEEDLKQLVDSVARLVPLGLRVKQSELRDKLNLSEPDAEDELLVSPRKLAASSSEGPPEKPGAGDRRPSLHAAQTPPDEDQIAEDGAKGAMADALMQIRTAVEDAESLDDLRDRLTKLRVDLDTDQLAQAVRDALLASQLAGQAEIANG